MSRPCPHRTASSEGSTGTTAIIDGANKDDRFKLLEDSNVLASDLDNPIHPIFQTSHCFKVSENMKQALQLASLFLHSPSVLEFFAVLLHGRMLIDEETGRAYLSDPIATASKPQMKRILTETRKALNCLAHCITFCAISAEERVYGRTMIRNVPPACDQHCYPGFQRKITVQIEISNRFERYYLDKNGYESASLCQQFRHDFLFATTLVHEIVHAVGVMKRGSLLEPYVRLEYPETEWGFAWEHFMFGAILNPQDRIKPGTYLILRKTWTDAETFDKHGEKEYCAVPVSYMAQWFRKSTWKIIKRKGPAGIPLSSTRLKIVASLRLGRWIVSSDCEETKQDLLQLRDYWKARHYQDGLTTDPLVEHQMRTFSMILWRFVKTEELQKSDVPQHMRIPNRMSILSSAASSRTALKYIRTNPELDSKACSKQQEAIPPPQPFGSSPRKRKAHPGDHSARPNKVIKL